MVNNRFQFSQKVTGQERKVIAALIAEAVGGTVKYTGAPTFAYETSDERLAGSWLVDKESVVHSPEIDFAEVKQFRPVIDALNVAGLSPEGVVKSKVAASAFSETSFANFTNLVKSKERLIKKAIQIEKELEVSLTDQTVSLDFGRATLNADELLAYLALALKLIEQAKTQKRVSAREKPADNEKYAFRCFLLRLGFIGEEYKKERKILLEQLTGNAAFKGGGSVAVQEAEPGNAE